jgi:UDP-glucose 4-epimerase
MNVLVTGGAGFIGSHAVKKLMQREHNPIVIDNLFNGHRDAVLSEIFYEADLRDIDDIRKIFEEHSIDAVMHFAAVANVPDSVRDPHDYYTNNIQGGLNLLQVMKEYDCNKMIFSSSASVYGEPETDVIKEDHQKHPTNPYGHTKLVFEDILKWYGNAYNLSSISFRYFCAAGSDPDGEIGERHKDETHVIPVAIFTAIGKRPEFCIYGDDYPTKDGTGVRDFIHVMDLVEAHILGLEKLERSVCKQFNLGIGKGFSVREIIKTVSTITGNDFPVTVKGRRPGDPSMLIADPTAAKNFLGWEPKYVTIESIIETAYHYLSKIDF